MMRYQEPEMEIITFESANIVTESNLYTPGSNTGGNEGGLGWGEF